jgi:lipoprotein-anchoring transpeptidase ErfK/SrfK
VTPTPVGEFHITQKIAEQTISGTNPNGTTYYQPHVLWSDDFDNSGDAISGNSTQPTAYFGNINTSRGSVWLQNSDAEWVYDWAAVGTTVITHN